MTTENATYVGELDPSLPSGPQSVGQGDDHLRLTKSCLVNTLQGSDGDAYDTPLTVGPRYLNNLPDLFAPEAAVTLEGEQTITGKKTFEAPIIAEGGIDSSDGTLLIGSDGGTTSVGTTTQSQVQFSDSSTGVTHAWTDGSTPRSATALNTSNLATEAINILHPVGSVIFSVDNNNPAGRFPDTVWQQVGQGQFVAGVGTGNDGDYNHTISPGAGTDDPPGQYRHRLTVDELPAHSHGLVGTDGSTSNSFGINDGFSGVTGQTGGGAANGYQHTNIDGDPFVEEVGSAQAHINAPPSFGLYIWQRTG